MSNQLFYDLLARSDELPIHFAEAVELQEAQHELEAKNVVFIRIDAGTIDSQEDLFRAFSIALKKPSGWYGDEEFAPNANAFLEYLDDVEEWIPGRRVVTMNNSELFWKKQPRLAGFLCELWLLSALKRGAKSHLLFVW